MKLHKSLSVKIKILKCVTVLVVSGTTLSFANANDLDLQQYQLHNMLGSITNSTTSTIGSSMGFAQHTNNSKLDYIDGQTQKEQPFIANKNSTIITGSEQSVLINDVTIAAGNWKVIEGDSAQHLSIGDSFGSITLPNNKDIAALNNANVQKTVMERVYSVPNGIYNVSTSLLANYVTTEFPEWVGSEFNDTVQIDVITGSGNQYQIDTPFRQELNSAKLVAVAGLPDPMIKPYMDNVDQNIGGQTGFIPVNVNNIPVAGGGDITIRVTSENVGDQLFPSAILVSEND